MRRDRADDAGSEYQVISILPSWGVMSLGLAVLAILSRPILAKVLFRWLDWRPDNPWIFPVAVAAGSIFASLLGLVAGIVGLRTRSGSRTIAGLGVLANGTVFLLALIMNVLFVYIRLR